MKRSPELSQAYPWYEIVESDELEQGDFIDNCKVLIPTYIPIDLAENPGSAENEIYQQGLTPVD
jgi:hypothetical protein